MTLAKSSHLRLLEGDRGHRTAEQKRKSEFPTPERSPKRPAGLDGESRKYWTRYVQTYRITEADVPRFSYLCELHAEIIELKEVLKQEGRFFLKVTVDGAGVEHQEKKSHPAFKQLDNLRKEKRILEKEFSLRAHLSGPPQKSAMEEMID